MLRALESFLEPAVDAALPQRVRVVRGPYHPKAGRAVVIHAQSLGLGPIDGEPEDGEDGYPVETTTWSADGATLDFAIPAAITGELLEVEAPRGYTVKVGDDYFLEERTIHFYQSPPAAAEAVRARFRGDRAAGWSRKQRCTVRIELAAYQGQLEDADDYLARALQVALAEFVRAPNLETSQVPGVDVEMRLLKPRAHLRDLERSLVPNSNLVRSAAHLELHGDLLLVVAKGAPQQRANISRIAGTLAIDRATGDPPIPEPLSVEAAPAGPPLGPRPIEAESLRSLAGVGASASNALAGLSTPLVNLRQLADVDVDTIAAELTTLSPAQVRAFQRRAQLVLAFPVLPPLPEAALDTPLATLLSLSPSELSGLIDYGLAYAEQLLAELLTLQALIRGRALSRIRLRDFVPAPSS